MSGSAQCAWVERVLGVALPAGRGAPQMPAPAVDRPAVDRKVIQAAIAAWRSASETVDGQVGQLQALLQRSDDPDLREIGEYGMAALSGGNRTRLMAAVQELDTAGDLTPALLKRASTIAAKFRAHLASDAKVRGFDENPFGVPVSIRATLEPALNKVETAVAPPAR
jgi:hypothetical protein